MIQVIYSFLCCVYDKIYWGRRFYRLIALSVFEAFRAPSDPADPATPTSPESENESRPFIYISAEDIFYPIVPRGYIDSKRQAERDIWAGCGGDIRGVFIRPGTSKCKSGCGYH